MGCTGGVVSGGDISDNLKICYEHYEKRNVNVIVIIRPFLFKMLQTCL